MNDVLLAIGPFIFYATAPSFQKLSSTAEGRWVDQDRLSRKPASQFIGGGLSTIQLDGIHYPERLGSPDLLDDMAASANAGDVWEVVSINAGDLSGDPLDQWTIRSVELQKTYFGADGAKRIEFAIKLKEYGSDNDSSGSSGGLFG